MNDVREAIERVGARFDPAGRFDDLARRRHRASLRRRVTAGMVALAIAAAGSVIAVRAFPTSSPRAPTRIRVAMTWLAPSSATPAAGIVPEPSCPTPSGNSPPPVVFSRTAGSAGSSVDVSGTFQTGELTLQLWWNADGETFPSTVEPPPWPSTGPDLRFGPVAPGPVVNLASVPGPASTGDCSFRTKVTIPEVPPGSYQILSVFGGANIPPDGTGYFFAYGPFTFDVTG